LRAAVIDIGSNSTRLLIGEIDMKGSIKVIQTELATTRLGAGMAGRAGKWSAFMQQKRVSMSQRRDAGGTDKKYLPSCAVERTLAVLENYRRIAEACSVDRMIIAATSAVREAANGREFAKRVKGRVGAEVNVLSGEQEALYSYVGALSGFGVPLAAVRELIPGQQLKEGLKTAVVNKKKALQGMQSEPREKIEVQPEMNAGCAEVEVKTGCRAEADIVSATGRYFELKANLKPGACLEDIIVMDVGGGSTEFIWRAGSKVSCFSVEAGAVRMTEGKHSEDEIMEILRPVLSECPRGKGPVVGVGGTATTMAAVAQGLVDYNPAKVHGFVLSLPQIERMLREIEEKGIAERRKIRGLPPDRADIIPAGMRIFKAVLEGMGQNVLYISEAGLLHGLLMAASLS